ncbi:13994_t:CDS:2, partial [Racocetra fulgida]
MLLNPESRRNTPRTPNLKENHPEIVLVEQKKNRTQLTKDLPGTSKRCFKNPEGRRNTPNLKRNHPEKIDVQEPGELKKYSKNPKPKRESSRNDVNTSKTQRAKRILQEPKLKRESSREDEKKENNVSVKKKKTFHLMINERLTENTEEILQKPELERESSRKNVSRVKKKKKTLINDLLETPKEYSKKPNLEENNQERKKV